MERIGLLLTGMIAIGIFAIGCGDSTTSETECPPDAGCSPPPMCNSDGTAPEPYPPCACTCLPGQQFGGGVCNENGCIVFADGDVPDADGDGGTPDAQPCTGDAATPPDAAIEAPPNSEWETVRDTLPDRRDEDEPFPLPIDPAVCTEGRWHATLPLGSAYAHVHHRDGGACEVWLGGETEDPSYDGTPTEYCRFPMSCASVTATHSGRGGPATIGGPYCVSP